MTNGVPNIVFGAWNISPIEEHHQSMDCKPTCCIAVNIYIYIDRSN
jgi:hypothetical protein